jgi:hypothetical protein
VRVSAYIDGFNLYYRAYYRALKQEPSLKWLNPRMLLEQFLLPGQNLTQIKYYTAMVSGRRDPGQPARQQVYLRALRTVPGLSIHVGRFLSKEICRPLVYPIPLVHPDPKSTGDQMVMVRSSEEKGSDVNLATHLMLDGCAGSFEVGLVISADTDLLEPIRLVVQSFGRKVGVISPEIHRQPSAEFAKVASFVKRLQKSNLRAAQFPPTITTAKGSQIVRPAVWV